MMKYRQGLIGFIIGAMLFSTIGVFAEGLTVLLNPYPIIFNGQLVEVESYNINGRTFLSLGDMVKLVGGTAKLNEVSKQIEITTNTKEVKSLSTATTIEYDYETKLPIGAEFVEYKSCKNAVRYNGNIYLPLEDLSKFGIRYHFSDIKTRITIFKVDDEFLEVDTSSTSGNYFLNASGKVFYNANLFSGIIGE